MTGTVQKKEELQRPHVVTVTGRHTLTVSGVLAVLSYDEHAAAVETVCGILTIGGDGLHVHEVSTTAGEFSVEGEISFLQYEEKVQKGEGGFLKRLMR